MKKRNQVVLKLKELNVLDKATKAKFIVASMTDNAYFTNPNPALAVITTGADDLEKAATAAEGGGKKFTTDLHAKEDALERDLNVLAAYVEQVANRPENQPNAVAIITSSGMDVKTTHSRGSTKFQVKRTSVAREVKMRTAFVKNVIYHWQMSTDGSNWTEMGVSRKGSFIKGDLPSAIKHYFRVAIEDSSGLGPWSDPVSIIVE